MSKGKRWTDAEKAQIVLDGLRGKTSIAELSRRHGFDQSQFYRWREAFLVGGTAALESRRKDSTQANNLQRKLSEGLRRLTGGWERCRGGESECAGRAIEIRLRSFG